MRPNMFVKFDLRKPVRVIFVMALIAFMTFTFVMNAVDYLVVSRDLDKLTTLYPPVGSLQSAGTDSIVGGGGGSGVDVSRGAALIENSPHLALFDWRRNCSGVMKDIYNIDFYGDTSDQYSAARSRFNRGVHVSDSLIICEVVRVFANRWRSIDSVRITWSMNVWVSEVIYGYPEYVGKGYNITINAVTWDSPDDGYWMYELAQGDLLMMRVYQDMLVGGDRDYHAQESGGPAILTTPLTCKPLYDNDNDDDPVWYLPMDSTVLGPDKNHPGSSARVFDFDLKDEPYASIIDSMAVTNENQRTMLVTGTKDMSRSSLIWRRYPYKLLEGRLINSDDDKNANPVCMVYHEFARRRGLKVGDKLTISLRDAMSAGYDYLGYITDGDGDEWLTQPSYETEFEIVGTYFVTSSDGQSDMIRNSIIIPDSCMPAGLGGESLTYLPDSSFSFVLKSYDVRDAFIAQFRDVLAGKTPAGSEIAANKPAGSEIAASPAGNNQMASDPAASPAANELMITMLNKSSGAYWDMTRPILRSKTIMTVLYGLLLVLAFSLTAFIYLRQSRKEFAFMRSLGVPRKRVVFKLISSFALPGGLGLVAGGLPAWIYASGKAAEYTGFNPEWWKEPLPFEPLPLMLLVLMCIGSFVVLMLIMLAGTLRMSNRSLMVLLQGKARRTRETGGRFICLTDGKTDEPSPCLTEPPALTGFSQIAIPEPRPLAGRNKPELVRFATRQVLRSPVRAILSFMIAAVFIVALGWMSRIIAENRAKVAALYETTELTAALYALENPQNSVYNTTLVSIDTVNTIRNSGFISSVRLAITDNIYLANIGYPVMYTVNGENVPEIILSDSVDSVLLSTSLMDKLNVNPGDVINIKTAFRGSFKQVIGGVTQDADLLMPFHALDYPYEALDLVVNDRGTAINGVLRRAETAPVWTLNGQIDNIPLVYSALTGDKVRLGAGLMERLGLAAGDVVTVSYGSFSMDYTIDDVWDIKYSYGGRDPADRVVTIWQEEGIILPEHRMLYNQTGAGTYSPFYIAAAEFTIDKSRNKELDEFRDKMEPVALKNADGPLGIDIRGEEFMVVLEATERILSLLSVIYPVTVAFSVLVAIGLALLMTAQNAKTTSTLRVLGVSKPRLLVVSCGEQAAVSLAGLLTGAAALAILFGVSAISPAVAGLYLGGTLAGAVAATALQISRIPLAMLQVRE